MQPTKVGAKKTSGPTKRTSPDNSKNIEEFKKFLKSAERKVDSLAKKIVEKTDAIDKFEKLPEGVQKRMAPLENYMRKVANRPEQNERDNFAERLMRQDIERRMTKLDLPPLEASREKVQ